jgi:imidazole glycerol-phosphate synthase subunit HisF
MYRPRVIPVLLLRGNGLVKTKQFRNNKYIGDPINAVRIFNDLEADELVFLDIMATKENKTVFVDLVKQIGDEAFMPFAVGGGIRNLKDAVALINAGAEKVVLNTIFFEKKEIITEISKTLGSQSVMISIDVKKNLLGHYHIYIKDGSKKTDIDLITAVKQAEDLGAGEILINSITNDGMMTGYDLPLIKLVSESVNVPVVACGGAGNLQDLRSAYENGAHAVAAGSMFVFYGKRNAVLVNYPDKQQILKAFS